MKILKLLYGLESVEQVFEARTYVDRGPSVIGDPWPDLSVDLGSSIRIIPRSMCLTYSVGQLDNCLWLFPPTLYCKHYSTLVCTRFSPCFRVNVVTRHGVLLNFRRVVRLHALRTCMFLSWFVFTKYWLRKNVS